MFFLLQVLPGGLFFSTHPTVSSFSKKNPKNPRQQQTTPKPRRQDKTITLPNKTSDQKPNPTNQLPTNQPKKQKNKNKTKQNKKTRPKRS